jgi:hypothetical protein
VCAWRVSGDLLGVKQVSLRVARRQRQLRERFSVQTQTPLGHLLPLLRLTRRRVRIESAVFPRRPNAGSAIKCIEPDIAETRIRILRADLV